MGLDLGQQRILHLGEAIETQALRQAQHGRITHARLLRELGHGGEAGRWIIGQQHANRLHLRRREIAVGLQQPVTHVAARPAGRCIAVGCGVGDRHRVWLG